MILSTKGGSPAAIKPGCYRGCGASILFVQMGPRKDGKPGGMMPVDKDWRYGDGHRNLVVFDDQGRGKLLVRPGKDVRGREPHWGTCPARGRFKKRRSTNSCKWKRLKTISAPAAPAGKTETRDDCAIA